MRVIGLTGGIASGKSTVSDMLRALGADVLCADTLYHKLVEPSPTGPSVLALKIEELFPGVLSKDGSIDRPALGQRVFGHPAALESLGALTHPAVAASLEELLGKRRAAGGTCVVYDVPLLYERHLDESMQEMQQVIVVWLTPSMQLRRLMERNHLSERDAQARISSQMSLDEKRGRATWVVDNNGDRENSRMQIAQIWQKIIL